METPQQPTGSGKWIWRKPLSEDAVELGTLPDPRDARIAQLEAALKSILDGGSVEKVWGTAYLALYPFPAPERDMTITVEELDT